eukprot:3852921-Prymnesium_polylepis.1
MSKEAEQATEQELREAAAAEQGMREAHVAALLKPRLHDSESAEFDDESDSGEDRLLEARGGYALRLGQSGKICSAALVYELEGHII